MIFHSDMTNERLTEIYNKANGIGEGKNPPISTERIFAAMRETAKLEREKCSAMLNLSRADIQLMAGELTNREWHTVMAVLGGLQRRILNG